MTKLGGLGSVKSEMAASKPNSVQSRLITLDNSGTPTANPMFWGSAIQRNKDVQQKWKKPEVENCCCHFFGWPPHAKHFSVKL